MNDFHFLRGKVKIFQRNRLDMELFMARIVQIVGDKGLQLRQQQNIAAALTDQNIANGIPFQTQPHESAQKVPVGQGVGGKPAGPDSGEKLCRVQVLRLIPVREKNAPAALRIFVAADEGQRRAAHLLAEPPDGAGLRRREKTGVSRNGTEIRKPELIQRPGEQQPLLRCGGETV